ncbi:hypothetical protein [Deinococcus radiodurans]|uniref:Uncharacterized protein n=1 Tax=Deinococcus radiodurans (strain ATCC 13939 / DSM 20539 / JCM 16871 / CCUG 27074 / LMG 4051 / NBRC 15346 / NCIMB 9279 / VKM B-1422 / R1) TaxID=243230 RepID=Q9RZ71_DEIRA|nr:hypothetical protein [Deinococcus radiodurans]AAF12345.1 hypothetical protein DR_A0083 [Deinococcus radiodurans R1 = ATCC 13939 = DSM 20539]ANC72943.1 hypothetical protein A2G07_13905 [Deinococcus radiodurans R1 = ATCC 13939 = DSM 20539]QEM72901.1 hypothetical protein DXG80_13875 [Deinococcus radiodurans]QIP30420.1 hypothetical protein HAV23_14300 [Deinococcus radiodurans]QIP33221.1 hypothetical protein HAV35_13690 [Deinococcus radiodurans]
MTIDLERRVTAPDFTTDPLGYFVWHLETHPDMYRQFRQTADAYRAGDPARRLSADMICHVLRWQSVVHAGDDLFQVNNNLTALYARLYKNERPDARISTRPSMLDALLPDERDRLAAAFAPLKEVKEDA